MKPAKPYYLRKFSLPLMSTMLLFSSCARVNTSHHFAYAPAAVNAPFLKEKNQIRLSGNFTWGEGDKDNSNNFANYGTHIRAAYAVTNHFGISAAYFASRERDEYNPSFQDLSKTIAYRRNLGEISAGYFTALDKAQSLYLECYGGYGLGRNLLSETYEHPDTTNSIGGFFNDNYHQFYIQPAIVLHHKNLLQVGLLLRTSMIKFGRISTNYDEDILRSSDVKLYDLDKNPFIFFQPALSFRIPLSKRGSVNLNLEATKSFRLSGNNIYNRDAVVMIGITYSPGLKK